MFWGWYDRPLSNSLVMEAGREYVDLCLPRLPKNTHSGSDHDPIALAVYATQTRCGPKRWVINQ
jgi:hypothetical protein